MKYCDKCEHADFNKIDKFNCTIAKCPLLIRIEGLKEAVEIVKEIEENHGGHVDYREDTARIIRKELETRIKGVEDE